MDEVHSLWPVVAMALHGLACVAASGHAILYKRDPRSALAWAGLVWIFPYFGIVIYILYGVNRIERRAKSLRSGRGGPKESPTYLAGPKEIESVLLPDHAHLASLMHLVTRLCGKGLTKGNQVRPLLNGDQAYPEMLAAAAEARESITLSTYIFDNDRAGQEFVDGLASAVDRGVQVRVLLDGVGLRYKWRTIMPLLSRRGVRYARFLPTLVPRSFRYANLRNHRKIMVVDGRIGFTGGMNIREGNMLDLNAAYPIRDVHLRVEGPVVADFQEVFAFDWEFATGEALKGEPWFPSLEPSGPVLACGIADGPDEDFDKLRLTILGALASAKESVQVATPYFVPDATIISALCVAAMKGVSVDIVIPQKSNLPFVNWATAALLWQVLQRGCRVWLSPPPFDHSKLFVVDGTWSLLGSTNWDPRSLRLNFEFNIACFDRTLARTLSDVFQKKRETSKPATLEDFDGRSLPVRLRDGMARLLSPYL